MIAWKGIFLAGIVFFVGLFNLNLVNAEQESNAGSSEGQGAIETTDPGEQTTIKIDDNLSVIPDMQWLWGEVSSVDIVGQKLMVKYFDYEADTEKEIAITIEDKTNYENIKDIGQIKPLDTVSIDYIFGPEGKNIARNISIEKPDNSEEAPQLKESIELAPEAAP